MTDSSAVQASGTPQAGITTRMAGSTRLILGVLLVATFVTVLNETLLSVALPTLIREFRITAAIAQWLSTGFLLTSAVVIPLTGFLLQRLTTRFVFILAMALFTAGTAVAVIAPSFAFLLVARAIQAAGTAMMLPLLMSVAIALVPPQVRGRTMGNVSIVISVAPAIGPTLAGIVLNALSWRFLFIIVLPIAVASLIVGALRMRNITEPQKVPLDLASVILSAFAFGGLLYGLSSLGEQASGTAQAIPPWETISISAVALVIFALRQRSLAGRVADAPLLDLRTFSSPTFSVSIGMLAISCIALFGSLIVLPLYLQTVLGLTTLTTGLLLLPGGLVQGAMAPFAGRLYDRVGPIPVLAIGSVLVSAGLWTMFVFLGQGSPTYVVVIAHVILSIGLAFTFTPLFTSALGATRPELRAHGSAIVSTVQQLASGIGTALFIAVLSAGAASHVGTSVPAATAVGVHAAFLVGAIISVLAIPAAFFVSRSPSDLAH